MADSITGTAVVRVSAVYLTTTDETFYQRYMMKICQLVIYVPTAQDSAIGIALYQLHAV